MRMQPLESWLALNASETSHPSGAFAFSDLAFSHRPCGGYMPSALRKAVLGIGPPRVERHSRLRFRFSQGGQGVAHTPPGGLPRRAGVSAFFWMNPRLESA